MHLTVIVNDPEICAPGIIIPKQYVMISCSWGHSGIGAKPTVVCVLN